jgi:hypothetical protein
MDEPIRLVLEEEIITREEGQIQVVDRRPHIHTKHKVLMAIAMQPPDEFVPRHIHLHFCEGCHLVWWEEIKK